MDLLLFIVFLIACSLLYFVPTLIPFLLVYSTLKSTSGSPLLYLWLMPYFSYAVLEILKDRQGFNLPYGFLICGIPPGIMLLVIKFKPVLITHVSYGFILSLTITLMVWIWLPYGRLNRLF